jgi:hypothetical protein
VTLLAALVVVFVIVVATGPVGVEIRERRRVRRQLRLDRPLAKVIYLPTSACQSRLDLTTCWDDGKHGAAE